MLDDVYWFENRKLCCLLFVVLNPWFLQLSIYGPPLLPGMTLVACLATCTITELVSMWNLTRIEVHLCNMLSPEAPQLSLASYNWGLVRVFLSLLSNFLDDVCHIFSTCYLYSSSSVHFEVNYKLFNQIELKWQTSNTILAGLVLHLNSTEKCLVHFKYVQHTIHSGHKGP